MAYLVALPFSSNALGNLGHRFTNWICDSPIWSQHIEGRQTNIPHQIWAKTHHKRKPPFNRFVLMVNHTKMGLNWPHLGHVASVHLPSLQTSGDISAPTIGITVLVLTIMNFVGSSRGWFHLQHEIFVNIKYPCFCGNQVTPVSRVTNQLWRVLSQFYASIYTHMTSLIASRRCRQANVSVAFAGSSNLIKKVRSVVTSQVVAVLTMYWWYWELLLRNAVRVREGERHSISLFAPCAFQFHGLTEKLVN